MWPLPTDRSRETPYHLTPVSRAGNKQKTAYHPWHRHTLTPLPDMRKGMGIFSPVSGWMMAWGHNESTDSRQDEEEETRENKRWERADGRIIMLRLAVILLSLHRYTELQLVSATHCARRCWVIRAGSFIIATCKRLSTLFTLTCLIFCASQSYCEKQRNMQKREMFTSISSSLCFCCVTKVTKKTEVLYTTHVNFDWNLSGWCLFLCPHIR